MEFCPHCGKYSLEYDPYRNATICLSYDCSCIIVDKNTYSYLNPHDHNGEAKRVSVKKENKVNHG